MSRVTILMTVYNGLPFVDQAIQSIRNQTLADWRCVIVNDGSTDGTREYLESIRDTRFIIVNQENAGISAAMNHGLKYCSTPYLARLDADDIAVSTRLKQQVDFLDAHPKVGLVGTQVIPIGERGQGSSLKLPIRHDQIMRSLLSGRHAVVHSSIMLRTDLLKNIGGYWTLPMGEEFDMMLRMGEVTELANLDHILLLYRVHSASLTDKAMRLSQFRIALACELARRRRIGLPAITPEQFQALRSERPWWRRCFESCDIHARRQYRTAIAELYGKHPLRGRVRLAYAALCSPRLTIERILRMACNSRPQQQSADLCSAVNEILMPEIS